MSAKLLMILTAAVACAGCGMSAEDSAAYYNDPGVSAPPPSDGETYENYGTNPFVDAREDSQVTFSVDVDTGSYTLARNSLEQGAMPTADGVRVEEFVNFFDYRDAPPADLSTPFAIHTEAGPSPFGEGMHLLRVALKGYDVNPAERPAANLVFLVDVSGSMNAPNKLGLVKYSLRRLTETLRPDDTIGLAVYAGNAGVVLDPTPVSDAETIIAALDQLSAGGSTHGSAGIQAAYGLAEQAFKPNGVNRVILCSDGDFNVGVTGTALYDLIEEKREGGVSLSVFGFGRGNYNDRDMEQMADRGNGNYAFIDKQAEAERVLVKGVTGTLLTIAKDVKIQVDINADLVGRYRLVGYENRDIADDDFRNDAVDAGEIGSGHTVTAFIEAELVEGYADSDAPLATVRVRYKDPAAANTEDAIEISQDLGGDAVIDEVVETSRAFRFGAAVAEFAEILRGSEHATGSGFDAVIELASGAARDGDADQAELIRLVEIARDL